MLAAATKTPELEIDKEEGKLLAENIAAVNAHYGKVIDPKVMAWTGLIMACGKVYGTRALALRLRWAEEKQATKRPNNIVKMAPPAAPVAPARIDPAMNPLGL